MANTGLQILGWVIGLGAWVTSIATTLSQKWRVSNLQGEDGAIVDVQTRYTGLWSACSEFSDSETECTLLPIQIGQIDSVIIGCRALMILSIIFGLVGAAIILFAFKCVMRGAQDLEQKALLGKYGGGIYLMCGVCVATSAAWYIADIFATTPFLDGSGYPAKWKTGEATKAALAAGILWILASFAVMFGSHQKRLPTRYEAEKKALEEYI